MSASLNIHIRSISEICKENLVFFNSETWDASSEMQIIQKLHEIIGIVRPHGKKIELNIDVLVDNKMHVLNLIKINIKKGSGINTRKLTKREIEIIGLLMQGYSSEEIAEKLFICFETVKSHRKHILEKTGAKNTAALISYYHQTFFEK